jgi:uncharacterized membrane protein
VGLIGVILYLVFCIIVGSAASNRGRSGFGYFFISLLITPLITFIIILALGENKNMRRERIYEDAEIRESVAYKYRRKNNVVRAWTGITFTGESDQLLSGTRWELRGSNDSHRMIELLASGVAVLYHMNGSIYTDGCKNSTWERQGNLFKMTVSNGFALYEGNITTKDDIQTIIGSGKNSKGDSWNFAMTPRFVFKNITPESVMLISDKTEDENIFEEQNNVQDNQINDSHTNQITDELERLSDMFTKGLITLEEFNIAKRKLLE